MAALRMIIAGEGRSRPRAPSRRPAAARSRSRTSSSVVWAKSQYERPTAKNGDGVVAHTTSSSSSSSSSHVEAGAAGTATTMRAGFIRRNARIAARMLDPVARPSSTTMVVRPAGSAMGRPSR